MKLSPSSQPEQFSWRDREDVEFSALKGKTFTSIVVSDDKAMVTFADSDGEMFQMFHEQDCCESVSIESIDGDLNDMLNTEILDASEETNSEEAKDAGDDSHTWTFYKLATIKGRVTIRWYGASNGYYSESVSLYKKAKKGA